MPNRAHFGTLILACLLFVTSSPLHAIDIRQLPLKELANRSERIVLARCLAVEAREIPMGIFTFSSFSEEKVLKGPGEKKDFTLRLPGGQIGTKVVDAPGLPSFNKGETFILFLGKKNKDGFPTLFPQGVFRARPMEKDPKKLGFTQIPPDLPLKHADSGKPYQSSPEEVPFEDFLYSISKLLAP